MNVGTVYGGLENPFSYSMKPRVGNNKIPPVSRHYCVPLQCYHLDLINFTEFQGSASGILLQFVWKSRVHRAEARGEAVQPRQINNGGLASHAFPGCDASVLIDSQNGNQSEKESGANWSLRGFDLIDEIKRVLETLCPLTVSCADLIALATRDSIVLAGGQGYNVPTGRRDGLVSNVDEVSLPGPGLSVTDALQSFNSKGMTPEEMITLLGAHT
ncbi:unnamed protein product [Trifolium pratense]|uniref:Uncharacterized protein n=1 Tax=Trifolium pratense TaxID=57577 RepID=A0ACB0LU69_TRIPR|nr:unnamed protein product [Trifolium pratense]